MARRRPPEGPQVHRLRAELVGTRGAVVRDVLVRSDVSLGTLHDVLQAAFEWEDCHLHQFTVGAEDYADPDAEIDDCLDEHELTLAAALPREGSALEYLYDFGDAWEVRVSVLEHRAIAPDDRIEHFARLVGGRGAAPPEDCGGVEAFLELCAASTDPDHPERDEILEPWDGEPFDPDAFDAAAVGAAVAVAGTDEDPEGPRPHRLRGDDAATPIDDGTEGDEDEAEDADDADLEDDPPMSLRTAREVLSDLPYDADSDAHVATWSSRSEDDRIESVAAYHRVRRLPEGEKRRLHAAFHVVVENQIADGDPPAVAETVRRLQAEGVSRHAAVHAVGAVLVEHVHRSLAKRRPIDVPALEREIRAIDSADWR